MIDHEWTRKAYGSKDDRVQEFLYERNLLVLLIRCMTETQKSNEQADIVAVDSWVIYVFELKILEVLVGLEKK